MKYEVLFSYTVVVLRNGINFQGKRGDVQVSTDEPVNVEDPEILQQFAALVYDGLQSQLKPGEFLIANKFAVTKITPLV